MKTLVFPTSVIIVAAVCLLTFGHRNLAFAQAQGEMEVENNNSHSAQAAKYREEAEQLQQAIQRYQLMEEIYEKGSKGRSPGFNPQGRRNMAERVKRVIQYYTQAKQELEQLAAAHEKLAQVPHVSQIQ